MEKHPWDNKEVKLTKKEEERIKRGEATKEDLAKLPFEKRQSYHEAWDSLFTTPYGVMSSREAKKLGII
tara:strand:- start:9 stop:215 length:207 start_codon:yes stop_codon:yes gene_type:complete